MSKAIPVTCPLEANRALVFRLVPMVTVVTVVTAVAVTSDPERVVVAGCYILLAVDWGRGRYAG